MKAMILAAGFGTRLGTLTNTTPKILIDINGKSVLELILTKLLSHGFDDVIINVHYLADMIEEEAFKLGEKLGIKISISDEREKLLDTGGGVYKAKEFFQDESFLLYNGDILTDINLKAFYNFHIRKEAAATVAIRERPGTRFFLIDDAGRIRGWTNRQTGVDIVTIEEPMELKEIASMALTVISPKIFEYMEDGIYSMTSILLDMAADELITTFVHNSGHWIDIGSPEKLEEARKLY